MTDATSSGVPPMATDWIVPDWPKPRRVRALMTTRNGGVSAGAWAGASGGGGCNLGLHCGDEPEAVVANRARLAACLPAEPGWLRQVHGVRVVDAGEARAPDGAPCEADALFATMPRIVCAVQVADCLPVLLCDRDGTRVAAAHAGWRGLAAGVLEATLARSGLDADRTFAWLGPCIGPTRFEVGDEVRDLFIAAARGGRDPVDAAFVRSTSGKWLADLPALASARLAACGVRDVTASGLCTVSDPRRFYSYRRDGVTGRMAAAIWIDD